MPDAIEAHVVTQLCVQQIDACAQTARQQLSLSQAGFWCAWKQLPASASPQL
jgi:hypothetical protein